MATEHKNKKTSVKICLAMAVCLAGIPGCNYLPAILDGWCVLDDDGQTDTPGPDQDGQFGGTGPDAVTDQGVTDFGLPPFYGQTGWASIHRDSRNSDYAPFVMPSRFRIKWNALERGGGIPGAATFVGPTQGVDGGLWQHSGRGTGFSHLHKLDPDTGEILFETQPWTGECEAPPECVDQDPSTPDFSTLGSGPLVDLDGNVYIADLDQYWSYDAAGSLRWVVRFNDLFDPIGSLSSTFASSFITKEGFVGGITTDCHVALFNREDGSLAVPIVSLPCGPTITIGPAAAWVLSDTWYPDGEVYYPFRQLIMQGLFGGGPPNVNTPAVDPESGRIFFVHSDAVDPVNHDAVTAIDLVDDGSGGKEVVIAWSSNDLGPKSGSSVAISPDGSSVYTVDGNNTIWGFDTDTGAVRFSAVGLGQAAGSVTVGPDGFVYSSGASVLVSTDPADGSTRWAVNFDSLAQELLPTLEPTDDPEAVPDGTPYAESICVVSVSENKVWTNLVLGYYYYAFVDTMLQYGGDSSPLLIPHKNLLVAVDRETGELIDGAMVEYDGGNEGLTVLNPDGSIYISKGDLLVSPFWYSFAFSLPNRFKTPKRPMGGITAFEPYSFREFSIEGVDSVKNQIQVARSDLLEGDLQDAFTQVRRGRLQLGFTADSVLDAAERDEISIENAEMIRGLLLQAADGPMTEAYDLLFLGDPDQSDQEEATQALQEAIVLLEEAGELLQDYIPVPLLNYTADSDTDGNMSWENQTDITGYDWNLFSPTVRVTGVSALPGISAAYQFEGGQPGNAAPASDLPGDPTDASASFEVWFKPSDLSGDEIIFEVGGNSDGISLALSGSTLLLTWGSNGVNTQLQHELSSTEEFIQAIAVIEFGAGENAAATLSLYVDGELMAQVLRWGMLAWGEDKRMGVGGWANLKGGNNTGKLDDFGHFVGQIAIVQLYESALGAQEVAEFYTRIAE